MPEITVQTAVGWLLFWRLAELGYGHSRTQTPSPSEEGTLHALWLCFLPGFHNGPWADLPLSWAVFWWDACLQTCVLGQILHTAATSWKLPKPKQLSFSCEGRDGHCKERREGITGCSCLLLWSHRWRLFQLWVVLEDERHSLPGFFKLGSREPVDNELQ